MQFWQKCFFFHRGGSKWGERRPWHEAPSPIKVDAAAGNISCRLYHDSHVALRSSDPCIGQSMCQLLEELYATMHVSASLRLRHGENSGMSLVVLMGKFNPTVQRLFHVWERASETKKPSYIVDDERVGRHQACPGC